MVDIMTRLTRDEDVRRVVQVRKLLFLIWLVNVLANAAFFLWNAIDIELYDFLIAIRKDNADKSFLMKKVAIVLFTETLWAIYGFGWLIHGVLFMIWICFANYLVERDILSNQSLVSVKSVLACSGIFTRKEAFFQVNYNANLRMDLSSKLFAHQATFRGSLVKLYTALQTVTCLQEQVNQHLGLLPFLWLCELFISSCLRITQVALLAGVRPSGNTMARLDKSIRSQIEYHLEYFVEYLVLAIFYITFIATVEYFAAQRVTLFQLESSLINAIESEQMPSMGTFEGYRRDFGGFLTRPGGMGSRQEQQLTNTFVLLTLAVARKYIKSRYRAWCRFNLNYRLVFAFINAAAPFSVMILQLHG